MAAHHARSRIGSLITAGQPVYQINIEQRISDKAVTNSSDPVFEPNQREPVL